jgi:hypothetical protein
MRAKEILLGFFNSILRTGEIPEKWYLTKVVPILKPGKSPASPYSFRPISLMECDRKLMEKMFCTRLDIWAERNNVLSFTQYGFRKVKGKKDDDGHQYLI